MATITEVTQVALDSIKERFKDAKAEDILYLTQSLNKLQLDDKTVIELTKDLKLKTDIIVSDFENRIKDFKAFDYIEAKKPTITTNPEKTNAIWIDSSTGVIYVCVDNTKDKNKWVSEKETVEFFDNTFNTVDIFRDGSCISYFSMKNTIQDLASSLTLVKNDCILKNDYIESPKWVTKGLLFNDIAKIDLKKYKNFTITILHKHKQRTDAGDGNGTFFPCSDKSAGNKDQELVYYKDNKDGKPKIGLVKESFTLDEKNFYLITYSFDGKYFVLKVFSTAGKLLSTEKVVIGTKEKLGDTLLHTNYNTFKNAYLHGIIGDVTAADDTPTGFFKNFRIFNRILTDGEAQVLSKEN